MSHLLFVSRVVPGVEERIAELFAQLDRTELPTTMGVRHRSLYSFHDLYLHVMEKYDPGEREEAGPAAQAELRRTDPTFVRIREKLAGYLLPYAPDGKSHEDSVARCFYSWEASVPARPR